MVPTAAVTAIAPLAIAYLVGIPLLGTALPFLAAKTLGAALPAITPLVWIALAGILVIFITKLLWYDHLYEMGIPGTAFLLLVFAEGIVQLPRFGFHSLVLAQRAGAFLALVEAFGIGLGVAGIQEAAERLGVQRSAAALGTLVATVACSVTLAYRWPLRPLQGYTMSSDTEVAEIVHIETTLPNFSWDLVANNDYAFALGQGYQYDPSYWIAHVNPRYAWPHWHTPGSKPYSLDQRYIFFFVSHRLTMPDVPGRLALLRSDRQQEALLRHWINNWTKRHGPMPIYFHNPDLTVYWLRNPSNPAT
jgi:hypothetical protein